MPPILRIHLLGQPRLFSDDAPVQFVSRPRTLHLLAYLLLSREAPVAREAAAFVLWPDAGEPEARSNLRRHLYQLQRALPPTPPGRPWILVGGKALRWNPDADCWLDVAAFERLSAGPATLADAVELYTGDLLESVYEDWVFPHRERLRDLHLADLLDLVRQGRSRRDYPLAIAYAQRLVARDGLREDVVRQLIVLRYEAGDRAGALVEYERFARRLRDEIGVDPMPETVACYEQVVRGAVPANEDRAAYDLSASEPAPPPDARPRAALPFKGRDAEMEVLRTWWSRAARGYGSLVMIGGETGIGKTRLASELTFVAEAQGGRVLRGGTGDPEASPYQAVAEALRSVLPLVSALDIRPLWLAAAGSLLPDLRGRLPGLPSLPRLDPDRDRARLFEALASVLEALARPRPVLLLLEDLHWAGAATAGLLEFLARRAPAWPALIVATYRDDEAPRGHPLRNLRRRLQRENLVSHVALRRLAAMAVEAIVGEAFDALTTPEVWTRWLFERSEGNPFFLEELIRDAVESGAVARTASGLRWADSGRDALPGSVRDAVGGRVARLTPLARSLAEIGAVVGPAFDVEIVREVSGWPEAQVLDGLEELLDRHLIREAGGRGRADYAFSHHLTQDTIYDEIPESVRSRWHRRVGRVMEEIHASRLDEIAGRLALHFDRSGESQRAAACYLQAARRAQAVHADDETLVLAGQGLTLAADPRIRFDLLALREAVSHRRGDRAAQQADLGEMEVLAGSLGDDGLACDVLRRRVRLLHALGEYEQEAARTDDLAARAEAAGSGPWRASALRVRAALASAQGHYAETVEHLEQALGLSEAERDAQGQIEALCLAVEAETHRGRFAEVRRLLDRVDALRDAEANQSLVVLALRAAAAAAQARQEFAAAAEMHGRALDLCRTIGDQEGEADAHAGLATATARLFRIGEALEHYNRAAAGYASLGKKVGLAAITLNRGVLAWRLGRHQESAEALQRAESLFAALGDLRGQVACALNTGMLHYTHGDHATAKAAALQALDLARAMQSSVYEAAALANLGVAERELGEVEQAIAHMEASLAIRRGHGEQRSEIIVDLRDLALTYLRAGRLEDAVRAADEMLALQSAAGGLAESQTVFWAAARVYHGLGDRARATDLLARARAALQVQEQEIPDPELRASFLRQPFNREIASAADHGD